MTRAPILSAVAAALLLGFAASVPAAAEDAPTFPSADSAHAPRASQGRIRQFLRHGACRRADGEDRLLGELDRT